MVGRDVVLQPPVVIVMVLRRNRFAFIAGDVGERVSEDSVN